MGLPTIAGCSHLKVLPKPALFPFLKKITITFNSDHFIGLNTNPEKGRGKKTQPQESSGMKKCITIFSCLTLLAFFCLLRANAEAGSSQVGTQVDGYRCKKCDGDLSLRIWKWNVKFLVRNTHDNRKNLENHMKCEILKDFFLSSQS